MEQFWDSLFPEIEDGDLELRAGPLDWLGSKFEACLRDLPITSDGRSWFKYKESRTVGYENDASTDAKLKTRNDLLADGKISAETFDQSVDETPKLFYENLQALLVAFLNADVHAKRVARLKFRNVLFYLCVFNNIQSIHFMFGQRSIPINVGTHISPFSPVNRSFRFSFVFSSAFSLRHFPISA